MKKRIYFIITALILVFINTSMIYQNSDCSNVYTYRVQGHFSDESKARAVSYIGSKKGICTVEIDEINHSIKITTDDSVDQKSLERLVRQLKEFYIPGECRH